MTQIITSTKRFWDTRSFGILLIRVAIGSLFLMHGISKVQNMAQTVGVFSGMGFPAWVAYFIAWLEVIGGAALILGICTWVFGLLFGVEMIVALLLGGLGRAFGSVELLLALSSFGIALTGSGNHSLLPMQYKRYHAHTTPDGSFTETVETQTIITND
jgi:putative oxidoreductase